MHLKWQPAAVGALQDESGPDKDVKRRAAECLLCIMSLLSAVMLRLEHLDKCDLSASCGMR